MPLLYALRNDVGLNNPHFGGSQDDTGTSQISYGQLQEALADG
jgi:hypothetical protein